MGVLSFCFKLAGGSIGLCSIFLAFLVYPAFQPPTIVPLHLDKITEWGGYAGGPPGSAGPGKGPAASIPGFPQHLAGLYYLDGNMALTAIMKAIFGDFSMLMAGDWSTQLSPLAATDLSYAEFDNVTRTLSFSGSHHMSFIIADAKPGLVPFFAKFMSVLGFAYDMTFDEKYESAEMWVWTERFPTFLKVMLPFFGPQGKQGRPWSWVRLSVQDIKPDGSSLRRDSCYTNEAGMPFTQLNPGKDCWSPNAVATESYHFRRLVDASGNVDEAVVADMRKTWGSKFATTA